MRRDLSRNTKSVTGSRTQKTIIVETLTVLASGLLKEVGRSMEVVTDKYNL